MPDPEAKAWFKPLSALLSQAIVAYTIEADNEFELRMAEKGFRGARLSLVTWTNLLRFVPAGGTYVGPLAADSLCSKERLKHQLGCLERWGFVSAGPGSAGRDPPGVEVHAKGVRREGWGSGRGINAKWTVALTPKGEVAAGLWPLVWEEVEGRWRQRFGEHDLDEVRKPLSAIQSQIPVELPLGVPPGLDVAESEAYPPRRPDGSNEGRTSALLSQVLTAFTIDFDSVSRLPLALCANTIRVLGESPVRTGELAHLTGGSPETSDVGWRLKPYVVVGKDPSGRRGKTVRLSALGLEAQKEYYHICRQVEMDWSSRYGGDEVRSLRQSLEDLLGKTEHRRPVVRLGLVPPRGVVRAGELAPALGRRDVGSAAHQRTLDLVNQTDMFLRDPAGTLPHYPLWDMNRGFGP